MILTATNYAMMLYGLEDYNHRVGPPIEVIEEDEVHGALRLAPSTLLFDFIKYVEYCESFGYKVDLTTSTCHITNE